MSKPMDTWPEGIGHMGVEVGTVFASRKELGESGLHKQQQAGIFRAGSEFAHSIVLSGGYKDDEDYHGFIDGEYHCFILYTGDGGRDPDSGRQVSDQELMRGNLGLYNSWNSGFPVRVVRGHQVEKGPPSGYRYDGLYTVTDAFKEPSIDGPLIWRFRMVPLSLGDVTQPKELEDLPPAAPKIVRTTVQRRVRNTAMISALKSLYNDTCQLCGLRIELQEGRGYSEGAHVQPLSQDGPDVRENILILCPNHHVMLDKGALVLRTDGTWSSEDDSGNIYFHRKHRISDEFIMLHNN